MSPSANPGIMTEGITHVDDFSRRNPAAMLWWRLVATSAALVGLAFVQTPGAQTADTKLDLVVDPGGMLARSLSMWDELGAFGQVGNQAYGYLWPMGPFFWVGQHLDMPGWVTQRLWLALVLVVAFIGCARLLKALGIRHDLAIVLGGLAFALSPRMLTTVGPISIEAWPSALAPWVLLPLVLGARQGSPRRYALGAALAVAMVGGVNAAATFAVIPLGVVWLLTRTPGPRRRSLMFWWPFFTALTCLWWLVPLLVLGLYSPPFLDYIETADLTTYPTNLFDTLRGTSAWIPYLEARWRSGADLITTPALILHSTVLMVLGLLGIARRDNPHRTFAVAGLVLGLLMVTFGHGGAVEGWFAASQRELLDGVLAPARNVHKFDPVIRIPMVLGLAHVVDVLYAAWDDHRTRGPVPSTRLRALGLRVQHLAVVWLAAIAVVGASQPAWTGRLAPGEAFHSVPDYWYETVEWLDQHGPDDRSLLLPGTKFGAYTWGTTQDEPIQPLSQAPWAVRNAIPLAPTGNIRALDALEERLDRGVGSAGVTSYLRRLGVRFLVVRNDLEVTDDVADKVLVHQALIGSPGIELVRGFGPLTGGAPTVNRGGVRVSINHGWQEAYSAVEVFEVTSPPEQAVAASDLPVVIGAPEDLLTLSEQGVLDERPTVLGYDAPPDEPPSGPVILTDGMRLRDRYFARTHDGASPTLSEQEARAIPDRRDYQVTDDPDWYTSARLEGARGIVASSSLSDARTIGGSRPSHLPYAAFDGDAATSWISRPDDEDAPTLRLELEEAASPHRVNLTLGPVPQTTSEVRVRTEAGVTESVVLGADESIDITLPDGPTRWIQVEDGKGRPGRQISVAELEVPGVTVERWLVTPRVPHAWGAPGVVSLDARADLRTGCAQVAEAVRCRPGRDHLGEEVSGMRRIVPMPGARTYEPVITLLPRPGEAVPRLLQDDRLVAVSASSRATTGASVSSAVAALDGLPSTTWVSSWTDSGPSLDVRWVGARTIRSITLALDDEAPALRPTHVTVTYPGGQQEVALDRDGRGELRPVRTSALSILVDRTSEGGNIDSGGEGSPLGAGVTELEIGGAPAVKVPVDAEQVDFGCGSGPEFVVDGRRYRTAVVASRLAIHLGRPVEARVCGLRELDLEAGVRRIELGATAAFSPSSVLLRSPDATDALTARTTVGVPRDGKTYRTPGAGETLVLRHNDNPGWTAEAGGARLETLQADGWQQAFSLPGHVTEVTTNYAPGSTYRLGLALGSLTLVACLLLYMVSRRRPAHDVPAPLGGSRWVGAVVSATTVLAGGLVAGWWGVGLAAGAALVLAPLVRRREDLAFLVALAPVVVVGTWFSVEPWGSGPGWGGDHGLTQLLMVLPLGLLAAATAESLLPRRDSGRSTSR